MNLLSKILKNALILTLSISFGLLTQPVFAMDSQLKGALYDINKYEKQLSKQTSKLSAKRLLKYLKNTRKRLDSSKSKNTAEWKQANKRYLAIVAHVNNIIKPQPQRQSSQPQRASAVPSNTKQTKPISSSSANKMISQQRTRVVRLKRSIEGTIQNLDKGGVKPFQDSAYLNKHIKLYNRYKQSLAKYNSFTNDSDVIAASNSLSTLSNMLVFGKKQAEKSKQGNGDAQAQLKQADMIMRSLRLPATPKIPPPQGSLRTWLKQLSALRKKSVAAYKPLPNLKQTAYLPNNSQTVDSGAPYDMNDLNRIQRGLKKFIGSIDAQVKTMSNNLKANVDMAYLNLKNNRSDQIKFDYPLVKEAAVFAKLLNKKDDYAKYTELLSSLDAASSVASNKAKGKLQARRMPKAVVNDQALLNVVRDAIAKYKPNKYEHEIGQIKRMAITSKKQRMSEDRSNSRLDTSSKIVLGERMIGVTTTTYHYVWDEFNATTLEKVKGKYYLISHKFKYYKSGPKSHKLNRWLLIYRGQGTEILEANIDK